MSWTSVGFERDIERIRVEAELEGAGVIRATNLQPS
jgi:hypothetical protein